MRAPLDAIRPWHQPEQLYAGMTRILFPPLSGELGARFDAAWSMQKYRRIRKSGLEIDGHTIVDSLPCPFDDGINFLWACGDGAFLPSSFDVSVPHDE